MQVMTQHIFTIYRKMIHDELYKDVAKTVDIFKKFSYIEEIAFIKKNSKADEVKKKCYLVKNVLYCNAKWHC